MASGKRKSLRCETSPGLPAPYLSSVVRRKGTALFPGDVGCLLCTLERVDSIMYSLIPWAQFRIACQELSECVCNNFQGLLCFSAQSSLLLKLREKLQSMIKDNRLIANAVKWFAMSGKLKRLCLVVRFQATYLLALIWLHFTVMFSIWSRSIRSFMVESVLLFLQIPRSWPSSEKKKKKNSKRSRRTRLLITVPCQTEMLDKIHPIGNAKRGYNAF